MHGLRRKNGLKVLAEYIDRAMTGTNDNRPEFRRMIRDSAKNAFGNVIICMLNFNHPARNEKIT